MYRLPFTLAAAFAGLVLLWWFKSLPFHRSAEERLQEANRRLETSGCAAG